MLEGLQIHIRKGQDAPLLPLCNLGLNLWRPLKVRLFRTARGIFAGRIVHIVTSGVVLRAVLAVTGVSHGPRR